MVHISPPLESAAGEAPPPPPPGALAPDSHDPGSKDPGSQLPESQRPLVVGNEIVDSQELTQGDLPVDPQTAHPSAAASSASAPPVEREFAGRPPQSLGSSPGSHESEDWHTEENWTSEPVQQARRRLQKAIAAAGWVVLIAILSVWLGGPGSHRSSSQHTQTPPIATPSEPTDSAELAESLADSAPASISGADTDAATETTVDDSLSGEMDPAETLSSEDAPVPADLIPSDILAGSIDRESPLPGPARGDDRVIAPGVDAAADPAPLMEMPAELEAFTRLLDLPSIAPGAPPTEPMAQAAEDLLLDEAADAMLDPMLLATPPPEVNIANALKLRVAIQTDGYPLAAFVLACSELTQVPIQIDWVTLDLANVSLSQSVRDTKPGWKSIGALMDAIASEQGLVFETEESKVFLTLSEADLAERLASVHALDDFGSEQESTKAWVSHFVASTQWNERERLGLRALVTDSLRRARGIPARLSAASQAHWTATADCLTQKNLQDFPEQWPILSGGDAGKQLDTAITLAGLLRQTSRVNQTTCVVNWDDARLRRLTPGQLVLPFADQPAGEMLSKTLAPMGLQVRVADQSHWWVGTAATYDRMPLLVIGDELGPRREEILQRIEDAAARTGTLLLLEHDPVSDRYLSLMPRFLYRQLPTILKPFYKE